jgi:hypothetical protein
MVLRLFPAPLRVLLDPDRDGAVAATELSPTFFVELDFLVLPLIPAQDVGKDGTSLLLWKLHALGASFRVGHDDGQTIVDVVADADPANAIWVIPIISCLAISEPGASQRILK